MKNPEKYECGSLQLKYPNAGDFRRLCGRIPHKTGVLAGMGEWEFCVDTMIMMDIFITLYNEESLRSSNKLVNFFKN